MDVVVTSVGTQALPHRLSRRSDPAAHRNNHCSCCHCCSKRFSVAVVLLPEMIVTYVATQAFAHRRKQPLHHVHQFISRHCQCPSRRGALARTPPPVSMSIASTDAARPPLGPPPAGLLAGVLAGPPPGPPAGQPAGHQQCAVGPPARPVQARELSGRPHEQLRMRAGHPDGPRFGNRGGKNKDWYTARARAARQGPVALAQFLRDFPKQQ